MEGTLNGILGVIPIIFFIVFAIIMVAAVNASRKQMKKTAGHRNAMRTGSQKPQNTEKDRKSYRMLEDRENDWLARQRREEAASERRFSAMYGLKRMHEANCPAYNLREEHRENCDANGVDIGTVR